MTSLPALALVCFLSLLFCIHASASLRSWESRSSPGSSSSSSDGGGVSRGAVTSKVDPHPNQNDKHNASSHQGVLNLDSDSTIPKPQESNFSHKIRNISKPADTSLTSNTTALTSRPTGHVQNGSGDAGPTCAYRLLEQGGTDRLCFRQTQRHLTCPSVDCQRVKSPGGSLVANVFANGSVLIQWAAQGPQLADTWRVAEQILHRAHRTAAGAQGAGSARGGGGGSPVTTRPRAPEPGLHVPQGGFRLSCWWNGSYTQFECTGVHLGSSCRDYLLSELHENVPYRICLRPLMTSGSNANGDDCVEFSVSPTGMQDIVIAMTTVGGAICVMLVIICLLVAYITENIMSPTTHTHMSHTHH